MGKVIEKKVLDNFFSALQGFQLIELGDAIKRTVMECLL